jgi:NADPH-dependent 2,4-dienoyl-CoA reductase/sulfur reductase-like enzyme
MNSPDLLIIGGGAAGLSAAATAAALGLSVELVDERPALGGNFYAGAHLNPDARWGADYARGPVLISAARAAEVHTGTFAWRVERNGQTYIVDGGESVRPIKPRRLLIATGAMERPVPIPGSTLPGAMYAGAAQLMLKAASSVPAGRYVLVGSGPLMLLLANQLLKRGAAPAAIVDTTPDAGPIRSMADWRAALSVPRLLVKGAGLVASLTAARIPWHKVARGVSIEGQGRAESVSFIDRHGRRQSIETDLVLLHDGVVPNDQVARQLGWQLGRLGLDERDRRARAPAAELRRHRAFRPFLEARFPPAISRADAAADDTVICRCENVTAGEIRSAIGQGATGPDQLKSFTRCGMGPCQGRTCSMAVAEIISSETGSMIADIGRQDIRAPLKPLPLGKIAAAAPESVS